MAAAAAVPRTLSDLPDDVLRRILFFAPATEGASTAVLSRRWHYLWRASGAVNLDSRCFTLVPDDEPKDILLGTGAGDAPITRLTIALAEGSRSSIRLAHLDDRSWPESDDLAARRRPEELRVEVKDWNQLQYNVFSLPSPALRLLRISNCASLTAAAAFPLLSELRLHKCTVPVADLQRIADAAPKLTTLHLESCYIPRQEQQGFHMHPPETQRWLLIFPEVTHLVLAGCRYDRRAMPMLELDAPRLRYFRYDGSLQGCHHQLSLKQQASPKPNNMVRVDLCLRDHQTFGQQVFESFWQFIRNFSTAKVLKVELDYLLSMDRIALTDDRSRDELLGSLSFPNLERLELEAGYEAGNEASMVMLADLLHCCPLLQNLRLKFIKDGRMVLSSVDKEARLDFDKSVNRFRRRRSPMISLGGEGNENHEVCYIPGLSGESFDCLQYLRRVSLYFCMEEADCLGVQLAKFFAENAMVLEEIYLHDGSQKMAEHMNGSVRRWIANSAKTRNLAGIEVLPH